jgi:hypothetical protein
VIDANIMIKMNLNMTWNLTLDNDDDQDQDGSELGLSRYSSTTAVVPIGIPFAYCSDCLRR